MTRPTYLKWIILFCLQAIESTFTLIWLISIPGEEAAAFLFGLSFTRILLAAIPIVILAISIFGGLIFILHSRLSVKLINWSQDSGKRSVIGVICICLPIVIALFEQISTVTFRLTDAQAQRLLPIEFLLLLVLSQIGLIIHYNPLSSEKPKILNFWMPTLLSFGFIAIMLILGLWGGIQPVEDTPYFSGKGAPLLPNQLFFIIYFILLSLFIFIEFPEKTRWLKRLDIIICFSLFFLAILIWSRIPIPLNNFTHFSNLKGGELVPYSDSRIYDVNAQQMILGLGLGGGNPLPRPLYSFFLALLHVILGQSFANIIQAQTVVLAILPVGIYLLGKRFYHSLLGLAAALFLILRETNQALLSSLHTLSSVRMMMSESFVAVFLVVLTILVMVWFAKPESRARSFIVGVLLGITALIRTQVLLLSFVLLLFLFFVLIKNRRVFVISSMTFLGGVLLVVFIWMGRNEIRSGQFVFEDTVYASHTILPIPNQGNVPNVQGDIFNSIEEYVQRTSSLLTNSMLSSLYQFPWEWNLQDNLEDSVAGQIDQPFMSNLVVKSSQSFSLIIHLFLIGVGLIGAWRRKGLIGLIPAGIYLGYDLSSAAAGFSGWRFILPVDWVFSLYWIIGVIECTCFLLFIDLWRRKEESFDYITQLAPDWKKIVLVGTIAACFLFPISESFFPKLTTNLDRTKLLSEMNEFNNSPEAQALHALAMNPSTEINKGAVLYPQLLQSPRDFWLNKVDTLTSFNQPVLIFDAVNNQKTSYFLPVSNQPDFDLHNTQAIIVSCKNGVNNQVIALLIMKQQPFWLFSAQPIPSVCFN